MNTHKHTHPDLSDSDSDCEELVPQSRWKKFLVVEGTDETRSLKTLSPFQINKGFKKISKNLDINKMRENVYLIKCKNQEESSKLRASKFLLDRPIKVSYHNSLNKSKGVIRCPDLKYTKEEEILKEMKSQGVIDVFKVKIKKGDTFISTGTIFLTFDFPDLPQHVKIGYLRVAVGLYIPSPLRCFKCQKFGHTKMRCTSEEMCADCAAPAHGQCDRPRKCINCKGDHPSSSKTCPCWLMEKAISRVRTEKKISFHEARKMVEPSFKNQDKVMSYADALRKKVKTNSIQVQTDLSGPAHTATSKVSSKIQNIEKKLVANRSPSPSPKRKRACNRTETDSVPRGTHGPHGPGASNDAHPPRRSASADRGDSPASRPGWQNKGSKPALLQAPQGLQTSPRLASKPGGRAPPLLPPKPRLAQKPDGVSCPKITTSSKVVTVDVRVDKKDHKKSPTKGPTVQKGFISPNPFDGLVIEDDEETIEDLEE